MGVPVRTPDDSLGGLDGEPAFEDRCLRGRRPLRRLEEIPGPIQGGPERGVPSALPSPQEPKTIAQAIAQRLKG
jgi:hypothetical protein